jgi:N-acetylglucosaminyldiphosphoundecaprenol N-acetyl-beta-D-mannosaminyltransferase
VRVAPPTRFPVLDVGIHALDLPGAVFRLLAAATEGQRRVVCCCDAHSVLHARRDPTHRHILNHAWLATPDGIPLVWLGRRAGHPGIGRVYGPDLLQAVVAASGPTGPRHFFYGGAPGVAAALATRMAANQPSLLVAGTQCPPHAPAAELPLPDLAQHPTDILWVGLSTPKQEAFMARVAAAGLPFGVAVGVGAAFDFLTGRVRQAPPAVRRAGLEWLWRLAHEPRRLGRRYLVTVPTFAALVLTQAYRRAPRS